MSLSSLFFVGITLLALVLTVKSAYNVYLYDDGNGKDEHCCLARIGEGLCLATPLTRSLVQVDRQCHRFDKPKHRRFGGKKRRDQYLEKITRRLDVQSSEEIDDKILLELKTPLKTNIIQKDLICLESTGKGINLEKCYLELPDDTEDDDDDDEDDDHMPPPPHKRRGRHHHHRHHFDRKKRVVSEMDDEDNKVVDNADETEVEQETRRIELHQPVRIREGHGLLIRQTYHLNLTHIRQSNNDKHPCLSWYRRQTRKFRQNPSKYKKSCIHLTDHNENCLNHLLRNSLSDSETNKHPMISPAVGSKLYCEDQTGSNKFLGLHRRGEICFQRNDQIDIEQKFTDIAGLSGMHKSKDILQFIASHKKYTDEFEHDCHDKGTLVEIGVQEDELRSKTNSKKSKQE